MQVLVRIQPPLLTECAFVLEISLKFRAQKIHHHRAGDGGVFGLHAVGLQALGGAASPAGLHAALGVAVHVEPVALLLRVGEHLLPVQVDDFVTAADVVVHMGVDGLVVVHTAGHQHLGLGFAEHPAQMLGVQQLADLRRVAPALQLQLEQQVGFVFPHRMLVQNQKIRRLHGRFLSAR